MQPSNNLPTPVTFAFKSEPVRFCTREDGSIWADFRSACRALELNNITNVRNRLDAKYLLMIKVQDSDGQERQVELISESGLYQLVFSSRTAEADRFRTWLSDEVLPEIRRTGAFLPTRKLTALETLAELIPTLVEHERRTLALEGRADVTETEVSQLRAQLAEERAASAELRDQVSHAIPLAGHMTAAAWLKRNRRSHDQRSAQALGGKLNQWRERNRISIPEKLPQGTFMVHQYRIEHLELLAPDGVWAETDTAD